MNETLAEIFSFDYDTSGNQADYQQQLEELTASLAKLSEEDPSRMGLLFIRGNIKRELGMVREAVADYDACLLWLSTHGKTNTLTQAVVLIEKADGLLDRMFVEEAEDALAHALAIINRFDENKNIHYLRALNKVGRLYSAISLPERAVVLHKRVLNALTPDEAYERAATLFHLGFAYYVQNAYDEALFYFLETEKIMNAQANPPGGRFVYTRYMLAEVYAALEQTEAAREANRRAVELAKQVYGASSQPLSRVLMQAGRLSADNEEVAVAAYRRGLDEAFAVYSDEDALFNKKQQDEARC